MADRIYNVAFVCTGNSARSILAESIINKLGNGRFRGFSAGSHPKGKCIRWRSSCFGTWIIRRTACAARAGMNSRRPNALHLDFVFTVCDNAAGEVARYWPGQPMTAHWGIPDPAAVEGSDAEKSVAFREAFRSMEMRIRLFLSLPLASIDRMRLKERMDAIGRAPDSPDDEH